MDSAGEEEIRNKTKPFKLTSSGRKRMVNVIKDSERMDNKCIKYVYRLHTPTKNTNTIHVYRHNCNSDRRINLINN